VAGAADRPRRGLIAREALRRVLADTRPPEDPRRGHLIGARSALSPDLARIAASPARPAAVLLPLLERPSAKHGVSVLFTERADHLRHHAGQVSFPGGGFERHEHDPGSAALREAEEEIGLDASQVEILGYLLPQLTVSGYAVTPVVGWVSGNFRPRPDPAEVASVFEVPLSHFLDPANLTYREREWQGACFEVAEFRWQRHLIWGATAAMLLRLREAIDSKDN